MKLTPTLSRYSAVVTGTVMAAMLGASQAFAAQFTLPGYGPDASVQPNADSTDVGKTIGTIATSVLNVLLVLGGVLAVFYLIYSGFVYITSAGSAERAKTARAGIINAVIGIVIILAAFFIVRLASGIGTTINSSDTEGSNNNSGVNTDGGIGQ